MLAAENRKHRTSRPITREWRANGDPPILANIANTAHTHRHTDTRRLGDRTRVDVYIIRITVIIIVLIHYHQNCYYFQRKDNHRGLKSR